MTHAQFLELTTEQKHRLHEVFHREGTQSRTPGINFIDWLAECCFAYSSYVGVNWCGMFLGIEKDGYCHS